MEPLAGYVDGRSVQVAAALGGHGALSRGDITADRPPAWC
jgi:hypothetical protein